VVGEGVGPLGQDELESILAGIEEYEDGALARRLAVAIAWTDAPRSWRHEHLRLGAR
jgi:hypothetical protein